MPMLQELVFSEDSAKEIYIDFCISSDNLDPVEITAMVEIQPSRSWEKGEKYLSKELDPDTKQVVPAWHEYPWGVWGLDTKAFSHIKRVEYHAQYLLDILWPKKEHMVHYLKNKDYSIRFYISWHTEVDLTFYEISSETLQRMSELCHYIEFGFMYLESKKKTLQ